MRRLDSGRYIVVDEMTDVLEPKHDERFSTQLDECALDWRARRDGQRAAPLAAERSETCT